MYRSKRKYYARYIMANYCSPNFPYKCLNLE